MFRGVLGYDFADVDEVELATLVFIGGVDTDIAAVGAESRVGVDTPFTRVLLG